MVKISTKINLVVNRETRDKELEKKIPNLQPLIRLFCRVEFNGLGEYNLGIIDTGGISLLSHFICGRK